MARWYWQVDTTDVYRLCKSEMFGLFPPHLGRTTDTKVILKWNPLEFEKLPNNERKAIPAYLEVVAGGISMPAVGFTTGRADSLLEYAKAALARELKMVDSPPSDCARILWDARRNQIDRAYSVALESQLSQICVRLGYKATQ